MFIVDHFKEKFSNSTYRIDNDGNDIIVMNCVTFTLARCLLSVNYCSVKL